MSSKSFERATFRGRVKEKTELKDEPITVGDIVSWVGLYSGTTTEGELVGILEPGTGVGAEPRVDTIRRLCRTYRARFHDLYGISGTFGSDHDHVVLVSDQNKKPVLYLLKASALRLVRRGAGR